MGTCDRACLEIEAGTARPAEAGGDIALGPFPAVLVGGFVPAVPGGRTKHGRRKGGQFPGDRVWPTRFLGRVAATRSAPFSHPSCSIGTFRCECARGLRRVRR